MLAGLGSQLLNYPDEFVAPLVDSGCDVIRLDNRDAGLSSEHPHSRYSLVDMAADVIAVLDAEQLSSVHLWGSSMGAMIAQTVAINWPERLRSLCSVQSTTGDPDVGHPDPAAVTALIEAMGASGDRAETIASTVAAAQVLINNPEVFDESEQYAKAAAAYDRSFRPEGTSRQLGAVASAPSRSEALAKLSIPATVIHGDRDPLIGISGGQRTAEVIPGAEFVVVEGMGHDLNRVFWPQYRDALMNCVSRSKSRL